jgi:hypothetical protein
MSKSIPNVMRWRADIERERGAAKLTPAQLDASTTLAIIHVESAGDPRARRPGSQFCGLLQMGRPAGIDVGLADRAADTTAPLLGDGPWLGSRRGRYDQR